MVKRFGFGRSLAVVLLLLMALVRISDPPPVEAVRLRTFDAFQMLRPRQASPQMPVAIVDIDEDSLRELGQWPWPRTLVADLITRLTELGAVAIGLDIVFAEPDRLSPGLIAKNLRDLDPDTRASLESLPSNDEVLANAIRSSRVILGQTALAMPVRDDPSALPHTGFGTLGPDPSPFLPRFPGLLRNVPVLEKAAAGRGLFTISPEHDGIVRRVPMILRADDRMVPSLTLDILRVLTGSGAVLVKTSPAGVQSVALPGFELPTDPLGQVWIHFSPHDPARFIPAKDLLAGRVPAERVRNKVVLVGTSAIGLLDNKTTPIDRSMPGVEVHAQVLESALTNATLFSPSYALAIEVLVALAVGTGIIVLAPVLGAFNLLLLGAAVAAFLAGISWYRYSHDGVLLDATYPMGSSLIVYLALTFVNYFREQMGRNRIRSAFGQYLSPALVEQLAQSPERLRLGGEERIMTIMFSDVRGFTTISESYKHDPQGLTALMNRFLTPLTNAILGQRGTIDKYMGDAIMAFWNAPLDDKRQEENACAAALEMLHRMDGLNQIRREEAAHGGQVYIPLDVGIGINTGRCVVGNMGSDLRFDYSVLGDTVNLASRLEGQSKTYGVKTVLGAATAHAVEDHFAVLEIDRIKVKGKTEPETIFTLLGPALLLNSALFKHLAAEHAAMVTAYRAQDWDGALALIETCRTASRAAGLKLDGLYDCYAVRIRGYRETPPPTDWMGVYTASTK
jgi:adenylate cyclase